MYIAGLNCSLTPQRIEGLVVLTTADFFRYLLWRLRAPKATTREEAEGEGGLPMPELETLPTSFWGKVASPVQALAVLLPPTFYSITVALNSFQQPAWMARFALPDDVVRPEWKNALRVMACVACFSLKFVFNRILSHADERRRMIGRREKPKLIRTGPYAIVRHPAYSVVLLQQVFYSIMHWSYIPLASLGVLASALAIKIPIEEKAAQEDDVIGPEYTEYMKRVPARVIPHIW